MKHLTIGTICVLIIFVLLGCEKKKQISNKNTSNNEKVSLYDGTDEIYTISVETIDSCEYIVASKYHGLSIIHKQNCKNHK